MVINRFNYLRNTNEPLIYMFFYIVIALGAIFSQMYILLLSLRFFVIIVKYLTNPIINLIINHKDHYPPTISFYSKL